SETKKNRKSDLPINNAHHSVRLAALLLRAVEIHWLIVLDLDHKGPLVVRDLGVIVAGEIVEAGPPEGVANRGIRLVVRNARAVGLHQHDRVVSRHHLKDYRLERIVSYFLFHDGCLTGSPL